MTPQEAKKELEEEFEIFKSGIDPTDWENPNEELKKIIEANTMAIKALKQQPKTGHWITDVYMFGRGRHTCSNCGKGQEYTTAFCSWCGADMRGEEE